MKKEMISIALTCCMLLPTVPLNAKADSACTTCTCTCTECVAIRQDAGVGSLQTNGSDIKVGSIITLGTYPQSLKGTDNTPIEWEVIAIEENKALVLSKYVLDCITGDRYWVWCKDFYDIAFSAEDKEKIVCAGTAWDSRSPGSFYDQYIIQLSVDQVLDFIDDSDEARRGYNTEYAIRKGVYNSKYGSSSWWLCERGSSGKMCVRSSGEISFSGLFDGNKDFGARPAMWIAIE